MHFKTVCYYLQLAVPVNVADEERREEDPYDCYVSRLREKHGDELPEFKLRCWARMLISNSNFAGM